MGQLLQLPYGGFVAPNIYYMGISNVIHFLGLRIAGISGIYNAYDHLLPRPSNSTTVDWHTDKRSVYHVRDNDLIPLAMLSGKLDIVMSHDWPNGIAKYGDMEQLLRRKPYFEKDLKRGELGSPLSWYLLRTLRPHWWTSAHLHVRYTAEYNHSLLESSRNTDEIDLDLDVGGNSKSRDTPEKNETTKFLALDKCKSIQDTTNHLTMIVVEADESHPSFSDRGTIYLDPEFMANLSYCHSNDYTGQPLSSIDINAARRAAQYPDHVEWDDYRIIAPSSFRSLCAQTATIEQKFFQQMK